MKTTISTDPLADMMARMRNAIAVNKGEVSLPYSGMKAAIARLLKANSFVADVTVSGEGIAKTLTIVLNEEHATARITEITRMSKPGRRQYVSAGEIPTVKQGRGIVIISTSKGLMTGHEARAKAIGGELICKVY